MSRYVRPSKGFEAEGGTPGAIRTRNLEIRSLSLYPLSYGGARTHEFDSIVARRLRLFDREHAFDEVFDERTVSVAFPLFHRVVVEVAVEFFGGRKTCLKD